jgi:hypothetical protein
MAGGGCSCSIGGSSSVACREETPEREREREREKLREERGSAKVVHNQI